jgi:putative spermidine/putrescine transport system ATP-binding protein
VTHDREEAMVMADQVVILDQGRIAQIGTPETVFQHPQTPYVASFMGAENIIDCEAEPDGGAVLLRIANIPQARVRCTANQTGLGAVQVHFRSELASLGNGVTSVNCLQIPGAISQTSYLGGAYRCEVKTACGPFFIDHPIAVAVGEATTVSVPADALHVYPREPVRRAH